MTVINLSFEKKTTQNIRNLNDFGISKGRDILCLGVSCNSQTTWLSLFKE